MTTRQISLKVITAPATRIVSGAPPVLKASDHPVDYSCGRCCSTILTACRAEPGSRAPDPLYELRIVQFNGNIGEPRGGRQLAAWSGHFPRRPHSTSIASSRLICGLSCSSTLNREL